MTSDTTLQEQIAEARQARAAIADLEQLKRVSDQLPALEAEAARIREINAARAAWAEAKERAVAMLEAAAPAVAGWRGLFDQVCSGIDDLAGQLPTCQAGIHAAAQELRGAAYRLAQAEQRGRQQDPNLPDLGISDGTGLFGETWAELAGPDLASLPEPLQPGSTAHLVAEHVRKQARAEIYRPILGSRQLIRMG